MPYGWGLHHHWGAFCSLRFFTVPLLSTDPIHWSFQHSLALIGARLEGYPYMPNLRVLARPPAPPSGGRVSWPHCPTPVHVPQLSLLLQNHPDQEFATFITQGLTHGFHIGYDSSSSQLRSSLRNHPSSLANQLTVLAYVREEVLAQRMVGPLSPRVAVCTL